ncbi:MAG: Efflux transporter, RND family, MFP subunit [uncultured bacterium]|nr:MAG: Efflux transporter, RND family, MFP subunit [uncultured bacterium]
MKKKKIIIWTVVLAFLALGGYMLATSKDESTTYTTESVSRGDLAQTVSVTGEVVSSDETELSFPLTGRIESVLADVGDRVVKGQKLATIDRSTFPQQLRQAELDIKIQKENLSNMERNKGTYSKDQRDAQKATIKKTQSAYESVLRQNRDNSLYAPVSGMVIQRSVDQGETVIAGKIILVIANPDDLLLESNVPEVDIIGISKGQKALTTFDALSEDELFMGRISDIDPAATVIQDVVYYRVKIHIENFDQRLKMGMTCNNDIITAEARDTLMVPQRAVKKENGKRYVEILREKDKKQEVEKVYVETGISGDNGMVEIKGNLLKEGEKVITFTKEKK